jgi:hypothetical protein
MACTCVKKPQKRVKMGALGDCEPHVWLLKKKKKRKGEGCVCVYVIHRERLYTQVHKISLVFLTGPYFLSFWTQILDHGPKKSRLRRISPPARRLRRGRLRRGRHKDIRI